MDLVNILKKTVSPDTAELDEAQKCMEQAFTASLPEFLVQLSDILVNPNHDKIVRIAAGLQLKNALTSKDANIQLQHQHRWLALDVEVRNKIKKQVLLTLGTENHRPSSAAQCIAGIACAELPTESWPELIPQLVSNVLSATQGTEILKESSLEAIGYICQDIELKFVQTHSNEILTAIVQGMRKEEFNTHIKLAATNALLNSLEITKGNFEKVSERNYIMEVVCEATQVTDTQVKVAALQCLVKIMSLYYIHMESYMSNGLFPITISAMKADIDEVRLQGIEFWSNVCDEEMDLAIEASEAEEMGRTPEHTSKFYAKGALEYLVEILFMILTSQQDDNDDEDEWNPCKAAGVCLMLLANCCENDIVAYAVPFITSQIRHEKWQHRDAAVMAFGSILEGPDETLLNPLVIEAFPILIQLLNDGSVIVRDTVAWTLGRICELLPQAVLGQPYFDNLLLALIECLDNEPRVAANVCWAFSSLAENAYELASAECDSEPPTYSLSQAFEVIVKKLLATTDRADAHQANLRSAAYEAVMEMVKNSAVDCYGHVLETTNIILQRIQLILQMESHVVTASDRTQYNDMQSLLCATLQSVLRKMKIEDAIKIADSVMNALLQMFDNTSGKSGGVQEDALLAVGTLVEVIGLEFMKYMDHFTPFLYLGLKNFQEYQVCLAAVGLVGDICRALNNKVLNYCPSIMGLLLENIQNDNVHRTVKPQILSVFGDVALAIGAEFQHYLQVVLLTLQQASTAEIEKVDYDMVDYLNDLREGCLEAYTGIVQGLKGDDKTTSSELEHVFPHVGHMVTFIERLAADKDHTDSNIAASAGLIGDLCAAFGTEMLPRLEEQAIQDLLKEGRRSKVTKTKTIATWATKEITKLRNALENKPQ